MRLTLSLFPYRQWSETSKGKEICYLFICTNLCSISLLFICCLIALKRMKYIIRQRETAFSRLINLSKASE